MSSLPTSPVYKAATNLLRAKSMQPSERLTPAVIMQRKADAEHQMSKLREARLYGEETRSELRMAEAEAGRSAAALRNTLRELDWAVVQLRAAKEQIATAVDGTKKKERAHDKCVKSPTSIMQVGMGSKRMGDVPVVTIQPLGWAA